MTIDDEAVEVVKAAMKRWTPAGGNEDEGWLLCFDDRVVSYGDPGFVRLASEQDAQHECDHRNAEAAIAAIDAWRAKRVGEDEREAQSTPLDASKPQR